MIKIFFQKITVGENWKTGKKVFQYDDELVIFCDIQINIKKFQQLFETKLFNK